jgi:hypothetical protein
MMTIISTYLLAKIVNLRTRNPSIYGFTYQDKRSKHTVDVDITLTWILYISSAV